MEVESPTVPVGRKLIRVGGSGSLACALFWETINHTRKALNSVCYIDKPPVPKQALATNIAAGIWIVSPYLPVFL